MLPASSRTFYLKFTPYYTLCPAARVARCPTANLTSPYSPAHSHCDTLAMRLDCLNNLCEYQDDEYSDRFNQPPMPA